MIKRNINSLCLAVVFAGSVHAAKGQKYVKDFLTHKVIVNQVDRTIVAYVKPVKQITLDTDKRYYWFSTNQINSTQGGFSGKLLNGSYQEFYASKQLKESGYVDKGLKTGLWKNWDTTGKLKDDYTWNFGKMNGVYHKYDSTGKVLEAGKYKNDLLNGKQKHYQGDTVKEVLYKKGKVRERKQLRMPAFINRIFHKKSKTI